MKIAVLRYRFVGDTILSLPFLRELRKRYPNAEIHYWTGQDAVGLMQYCPDVDVCRVLETRAGGFLKAVMRLRGEKYDMVYVLKRSFSSALLAFLSGAPQRIGFATERRQWLLTRSVPYEPTSGHEAEHFLRVLGSTVAAFLPELPLPVNLAEEVLARLLPEDCPRPWIVLHPHSTNLAKAWPSAHFRELIARLDSEMSPTFLVFGVPKERDASEKLVKGLSLQGRFLNLAGKTSLVESQAILSSVDAVVTVDSGMTHMAALADIPQVVFFGPSDPAQWRPLSDKAMVLTVDHLPCRPCRLKITCDNQFPCLLEITPTQVFHAVKECLK